MIDPLGPLVRSGIGKEGSRFVTCRQPTGNIDRHASHECCIVRDLRRWQAQLRELLKHRLVDIIDRRRQVGNFDTQRHSTAIDADMTLEASHHSGTSSQPRCGDESVLIHFRHLGIV